MMLLKLVVILVAAIAVILCCGVALFALCLMWGRKPDFIAQVQAEMEKEQ